jgi:hypothetical protein
VGEKEQVTVDEKGRMKVGEKGGMKVGKSEKVREAIKSKKGCMCVCVSE